MSTTLGKTIRQRHWFRHVLGLLALCSGNASVALADTATLSSDDRLIVPGIRVGQITGDSDEAALVNYYGRENVEDAVLDTGEGDTEPGTVLFSEDPSQRLHVFWSDKEHKRFPRSITFYGDASQWKTDKEITLGMSLKELEKLNAGPFRLLGFGHDGSGVVVDSGNSQLHELDRPLEGNGTKLLWISLSPYAPSLDRTGETYRSVVGDGEFSSGHPSMQALNPRVNRMEVQLTRHTGNEEGQQDIVNIVAFGDSTTAPRQVEGGTLRIYADILRDALVAKKQPANIINAGVGGNDTGQARARFEKDVLAHAPDIVIIQFGLNDSCIDLWDGKDKPRVTKEAYVENLKSFVETLRARNCAVILMTANPMRWTPQLLELYGKAPFDVNDPWGFNLLNREYAQGVRDLAKTLDVPLVDVYQGFLDYSAVPGQTAEDLLLDGMHPNDKGHALIAKWLMERIEPLLQAR